MARYKIVGGRHMDKHQNPHLPGTIYDPAPQELKAFPGRFELVSDDIAPAVTAEPIAELMEHLTKTTIFIGNTNPGVVLKAIADGRFTAKEALVSEMFGLERPELIASLKGVIEGRIEAHPDNVLTTEELLALPSVEPDQDPPDIEDDQVFDVTKATVAQVIEQVKAGKLAPDVALAQERGQAQPRKSLLAKLEDMME